MYFRPESHSRHGDSSTRDHGQDIQEEEENCWSSLDEYQTGSGYFPYHNTNRRDLAETEEVEEDIVSMESYIQR